MPITLNCPKCHKPFRVRDESIGGRVRCPSCGAVLQVPAALSPASHFGTGDDTPGGPSAPSGLDRPSADDSAVRPGGAPKEPMLGSAWRRVSGGLGLIRFGLFLFSLVFLGAIGHATWIAVDYENAMKDGPGFLGKEDWPRWKELLVAYTAGPIIPGVLMLLLGRLRCA